MLFRKSLVFGAVLFLAAAVSSQAQLGVYGMVTGERLNGITCTDPQGRCAAANGTDKPYGSSFGVYYDFRTYGPVRLGLDARGSVLNTNKRADAYVGGTDTARHYSALGGVRGTFKTPFKVLRPYAEVAAGFARSNAIGPYPNQPGTTFPNYTYYQSYTQVQGMAGLDLALFPILDLRVIEFSGGEMFGPSSHSIQSIGAGIVFHFSR
jgi:hypothetical protein